MSVDPEEVETESLDLVSSSRAAFEGLFPGVIADGVLDVGRLSQLLDIETSVVAAGRERFGLMWAGKTEAIRSLLTPSRAALVPEIERSTNFDSGENVFVEGDNLEVLKLLQKAYNDKVQLIYVDPPYNTGSDLIYEDDFSDSLRSYLEYSEQIDTSGRKTTAATELLGRRHSRWLSMMYPRLVLARNLLRQDGLIVVSIDDNEVANLRLILDEVFGPENYLNTFVWVSNLKGRQISGSGAAGTKEYMHVYARNIEEVGSLRVSASLAKNWMPSVYKGFNYEVQSDARGPFVLKNELYNTNSAFNEVTRPNLVFDIYFNPETEEVKTSPLSEDHVFPGFEKIAPHRNGNGVNKYHAFRWSRAKVEAEHYDLAFVPSAAGYKVFTKVRDVDATAVKDLVMDLSTNDGSADLASLGIDKSWFDYPKPVKLIQLFVACATQRDSLVMDFFAGSGTTGHAVALQNQADGGRRSCISVNLPEPLTSDQPARSAGLLTVADITRHRLGKVAEVVDGAATLGLRSFRLTLSNFDSSSSGPDQATTLDLKETTLLSKDLLIDDIAAEVLVGEGVQLGARWQRCRASAADVIVSDGVAVVTSLDITEAVVNEALALKPRVLVFLEDGFAGRDAVKANAFTSARHLGITMKTV